MQKDCLRGKTYSLTHANRIFFEPFGLDGFFSKDFVGVIISFFAGDLCGDLCGEAGTSSFRRFASGVDGPGDSDSESDAFTVSSLVASWLTPFSSPSDWVKEFECSEEYDFKCGFLCLAVRFKARDKTTCLNAGFCRGLAIDVFLRRRRFRLYLSCTTTTSPA